MDILTSGSGSRCKGRHRTVALRRANKERPRPRPGCNVVPEVGIEPTRPQGRDFESLASASSATPARPTSIILAQVQARFNSWAVALLQTQPADGRITEPGRHRWKRVSPTLAGVRPRINSCESRADRTQTAQVEGRDAPGQALAHGALHGRQRNFWIAVAAHAFGDFPGHVFDQGTPSSRARPPSRAAVGVFPPTSSRASPSLSSCFHLTASLRGGAVTNDRKPAVMAAPTVLPGRGGR